MDGLRFILEDPHAASSREKKRSRLVTACDTCRAKKIKCHQSSPSAKCEACKASKSACRFRDRERYHAQRSGSLSATSSAFNSDAEDVNSSDDSPRPRRATLPFSDLGGLSQSRSSSLPPMLPKLPSEYTEMMGRNGSPRGDVGPERPGRRSSRQIGRFSPVEYGFLPARHSSPGLVRASPLRAAFELSLEGDSHHSELFFDPLRPSFPSFKYMQHGAELFFDNLGPHFPFLRRDQVIRSANDQTLPAPLANCIVGLALRFSLSEHSAGIPRYHLGEPFIDVAKEFVMPVICQPSLETLHALLLLAWCEYGSGHEAGLSLFTGYAVHMALDIGLGHDANIQMITTEQEQTDLRSTWWNVVTMDIISSWGKQLCALQNIAADGKNKSLELHHF
ncbi:hypothetical protein BD410DRAFT_861278 [Rickenella mellea]|uniref:Zn(2)-C6 fungal-type domain-containing protein n=1 Tax=Rickenella mellea TaxID=50990 RepID=A0A4Y7Q6Z9_9AGAM|nr:hypothetical protein BD410DRAFT_861278 [Rickenella mellea]